MQNLYFTNLKKIGFGSFGVVYQANCPEESNCLVAIKRQRFNKRHKNREVEILKELNHPNVIKLKYAFVKAGDDNENEMYANLVFDYMPKTVGDEIRFWKEKGWKIPPIEVKLYMLQLLKALTYVHALDICHRDLKPQNLLVNPETGVLKVADLGSAKHLKKGEPNVFYTGSRFYRAPELILAKDYYGDYTTAIDIWSAGTVFGEMLHGSVLFPGQKDIFDMMMELIRVLGTPTKGQLEQMGANLRDIQFTSMPPTPWRETISRTDKQALELIARLVVYVPTERLTAQQAIAHPYFEEILKPRQGLVLRSGQPFPCLNYADMPEMMAEKKPL